MKHEGILGYWTFCAFEAEVSVHPALRYGHVRFLLREMSFRRAAMTSSCRRAMQIQLRSNHHLVTR
jgi:hypothetical protein